LHQYNAAKANTPLVMGMEEDGKWKRFGLQEKSMSGSTGFVQGAENEIVGKLKRIVKAREEGCSINYDSFPSDFPAE